MMHPQFGKRPAGERLERIRQSARYQDGRFRNTHPTPQITQNLYKAMYDYLFNKSSESKPAARIPSVPVAWAALPPYKALLVWLGHSSYFMRMDGKNILVDPVLSGSASPLPGGGRAFMGSDVTEVTALPDIDYLFISHDHYDHMDYKTLTALQPRVRKVITGLGVGAHLEHWGYRPDQIIEKDWWEVAELDDGFRVTITPARHFSGRSIWSANTLWVSFVLQSPTRKIYLGGDSGYDTHFREIGHKLGPFNLAVLENGQYDQSWKHIHMMPEEVVLAANDLQARMMLPVHSSKFVLANHSWYEPLDRVSAAALKQGQSLITPLIGEVVNLDDMVPGPTYWWRK